MSNDTKKMSVLARYLRPRIGLKDEMDYAGAAESIRKNIQFSGPNVLILACAIIIASVGLNVNSIPVIIGAMLISPLMGPIVGIGLSLGTNDMELFRRALKNLGLMVGISIAAATFYFLLSPLKLENPTELLARTNPTIYDVMIALFGGFAGILETSRKEKGTVLSGVAIATALMPPLCTIGYGLSQASLAYAFGALYLFFINSVFIALAAFLGVKYLGFEGVSYADPKKRKRISRSVTIIIVIIVIPSIFSAVTIVRQNNFDRSAAAMVKNADNVGLNLIYSHRVHHDRGNSQLELMLASDEIDASDKETLYRLAEEQGISRSQVVLNTDMMGTARGDKYLQDMYARSELLLQQKDSTIARLQADLRVFEEQTVPHRQIADEIRSQYPTIGTVTLTHGVEVPATNQSDSLRAEVLVLLQAKEPLSSDEQKRLQSWLSVRLGGVRCRVVAE